MPDQNINLFRLPPEELSLDELYKVQETILLKLKSVTEEVITRNRALIEKSLKEDNSKVDVNSIKVSLDVNEMIMDAINLYFSPAGTLDFGADTEFEDEMDEDFDDELNPR
jgi:hypothetical protein